MEILLENLAIHHPTLLLIAGFLWMEWKIRCAPRSQRAQNGMGRDVAVLKTEVSHIKEDIKEIKEKLNQ